MRPKIIKRTPAIVAVNTNANVFLLEAIKDCADLAQTCNAVSWLATTKSLPAPQCKVLRRV